MTKRMLIDATHAEETRVVVLDGNRLEDFDVETSTKRQLKGNIYLAKVVRVEPSLQAAFVEYGGNRHGFLAFGEIHPDYYQIPIADRQRLIEMQAEEARREEEAEDRAAEADGRRAEPSHSAAVHAEEPAEGTIAEGPAPDEPETDGPLEARGPVIKPATEDAPESTAAADPADYRPAAPASAAPASIVSESIAAPLDAPVSAEPTAWEPAAWEPAAWAPEPGAEPSGGEPADEPAADPAPVA